MYWHTIVISGLIPFSSSYPVYLCPQNNDVPFGVVCEVFYDTVNNLSYVRFFPIEEELFPSAGDPIRVATLSGANYSYASGYNAQNYPDLFDSSVFSSFLAANFPSEVISSATQAVRKINQYHAQQQSFVRSPYANDTAPYRTEVVGVHLFRDRVYAFCNTLILGFENGQNEVFPGDIVSYAQSRFSVIRVVTESGSWSSGDASGFVELDFIEQDTSLPNTTDLIVHRPVSGALTVSTSVTVEPPQHAEKRKHAVIRKSHSEKQAVEELSELNRIGWSRVPTMWFVPFREGFYPLPEIPVVDRRTGNIGGISIVNTTPTAAPQGSFQTSTSGFYIGSEPPNTFDTQVYVIGLPSLPSNIAPATQYVDAQRLVFFARTQNLNQSFPTANRRTQRVGWYQPIGVGFLSPSSQIVGIEVVVEGEVIYNKSGSSTIDWSIDGTLSFTLVNGTTALGTERVINFERPMGPGSGMTNIPFTETIGSPNDLWGATNITPSLITDPNFGISARLFATIDTDNYPTSSTSSGTISITVEINRIHVIFYYRNQFTKYYFHNAGEDLEVDVVACYVTEGSFLDRTARGFLQITNINPLNNMDYRTVFQNWTMHTAPGGAQNTYVATADAMMSSNAPESLEEIRKHSSRYRFITSNFYGDSDWDAIYGTSGAGRAFSIDKDFFVRIFTQPDESKDKPRHIANHHQHLALGFSSGNVDISVVGEPEDFSGARGATSIAVGDKVTGLVPMPGQSLGVFCEKSIWTIRGTVGDEFRTSLISPNTGAVEYTPIGFGAFPVYTSNVGIATLEQSERYGDFFGVPLSSFVSKLIVDRIQEDEPTVQGMEKYGNKPIFAFPVRSKNQYRLVFADGLVLTMTAKAGEISNPAFTLQQYSYSNIGDFSAPSYPFVFRAWSSEVDISGTERIHIVPESIEGASGISGICGRFVYEFERNWSFIDRQIPAYFTTNYYYGSNPFDSYVIRKIRFEGLHKGTGRMAVKTSKYTWNPQSGYLQSTRSSPLNFPKEDRSNVLTKMEHDSSMVNVAEGDRTILIRVESSDRQDELLGGEPPHVLQLMLVQTTPGGKQDG